MRTSLTLAFAALFLATSPASWACGDAHQAKNAKAHVNGGALSIAAGTAPRTTGGAVLHLEGVRVKAGEAGVFRLFVNHPHATASTPMSHPAFVDELFLVPSQTSASSKNEPHNFTFPIAASAIRAGEPVSVTLVPVQDDNGHATDGKLNVTVRRAWLSGR